MPIKRPFAILSCLTLLTASFLFFLNGPEPASARIWEWRQTDWSGGDGQGLLVDPERYRAGYRVDSTSDPGTLRLSHLYETFTRNPANPVLPGGGAGSWENTLDARPVRDGTGYEALYQGINAGLIFQTGYAFSTNGVIWNKYPENPVIPAGAAGSWNESASAPGPLLKEDDTYRMWFEGWGPGGGQGYGYAESPDGVHWTASPANPVFTPGAPGEWDAQRVTIIKLMHEGNIHKLWYVGHDGGGVGRIGYATSPDGITWTKHAGPVLALGAPGAWDSDSIGSASLVLGARGYLLAYSARDGLYERNIGVASSLDGVTWTKDAGNPIYTAGAPGSWNETEIRVSNVSFDGSVYIMMVEGMNAAMDRSIGELYSDSGGPPWVYAGTALAPAGGAAWDADAVFFRSLFLEDETARLFYYGVNYAGSAATGTATAALNYSGLGTMTSSVFSPGGTTTWGSIRWYHDTPADTSMTVYVRTGNTGNPDDGSWSVFTPISWGDTIPGGPTSHIQYAVEMRTLNPHVTPRLWDMVIDFNAVPYTWYFAEGYTGTDFEEWLTLQNPNPAPTDVTVTYFVSSGEPVLRNHTIPGNSRYTVYVNGDLGPGLENSVRISSTGPLICERPMYFNYHGFGGYNWTGGHTSMGALVSDRNWYFAEGSTRPGFDEWLTIQNPWPEATTLEVTYFTNEGPPLHRRHVVNANSRYTIYVNLDAGTGLDVSTSIAASAPVICERPMYFSYAGLGGYDWTGGHNVLGANLLSYGFVFAEGYTGPGFEEWLTVENPNTSDAHINLAYYSNGGGVVTTSHTVPAQSRGTIFVNADAAGAAAEISTEVESDQPVLVERPMYFSYAGMGGYAWTGGHDVIGETDLATDWYFAEGYTGTDFDTWLTVFNTMDVPATLTVTYQTREGPLAPRTHEVLPNSRYTINVNQDAGSGLEVSTFIHSNQEILVERPMYFSYAGMGGYAWTGGHDTIGFSP